MSSDEVIVIDQTNTEIVDLLGKARLSGQVIVQLGTERLVVEVRVAQVTEQARGFLARGGPTAAD